MSCLANGKRERALPERVNVCKRCKLMVFKKPNKSSSDNDENDYRKKEHSYISEENRKNSVDGDPMLDVMFHPNEGELGYSENGLEGEKNNANTVSTSTGAKKINSTQSTTFDVESLIADQLSDKKVLEQGNLEGVDVSILVKMLKQKEEEIESLQKDRDVFLQKHRLYHSFFHAFDEALLIVSPDTWQINDANNAASQFLGIWGNQIKDNSLRALVVHECRAILDTYMVKLLSGKPSTVRLELSIPQYGKKKVTITGTLVRYNRRIIGILLQLQ